MDDLREVSREPTFLEALGLERHEEHTTDNVRWVWFEVRFPCDEDNHDLVVQVEFELVISDTIGVSYSDNCRYSFNGVSLLLREAADVAPVCITRRKTQIHTTAALKALLVSLG